MMDKEPAGALYAAMRMLAYVLLVGSALATGDCGTQDRCLDAGGRWNAETGRCEGARPGG